MDSLAAPRDGRGASGWTRTRRWARRVALALLATVAGYFGVCTLLLITYCWVDPPVTAVQAQRRIESWLARRDRGESYSRRSTPLPLNEVSRHLRRAVVAAEDGRFFEHGGIDWQAVEKALQDNARGRRRGGSTISQQLAKNLFLTTHSTWFRKALEMPLTYLAEAVLGKQRILELYLNVAEWGPDGEFGAEAAARRHYGISATELDREQAARLAACLPDPRRRRPQRMDRYSAIIIERMAARGW